MNHVEAKEQLAIYRYLSGPERAEVDRHVKECSECASWKRASEALDRELGNLSLPAPGRRVRERFYWSIGKGGERKRENAATAKASLPRWGTQLAGVGLILVTVAAIWLAFQVVSAARPAVVGAGRMPTVTPMSSPAGLSKDPTLSVLKWRKEDGQTCRTLSVDSRGAASYGPCASPLKTGNILAEAERPQDLNHFLEEFKTFDADTSAGRIALTGNGSRSAGTAEQRAVAQWAELVYQELDMGRSGASWGVALAVGEEGPNPCTRIQVEFYGKVLADDCRNAIQPLPSRWLNEMQLDTVYAWMQLHNFEVDWNEGSTPVRLITSGKGDRAASDKEQQAARDWAANLYSAILTEEAAAQPGTSTRTAVLTVTPAPQPPAMDPREEFALTQGNVWVYQSTRYEGFNEGAVITATSTLTRTVVDTKSDPIFLAAKIREETSDEKPVAGPPDLQKQLVRAATSSEYWLVISGNRVYRQASPDPSSLGRSDYLEFVLPLAPDAKWVWLPARQPGDNQTDGVYRQVMQKGSVRVPAGGFEGCYLIHNGWNTDTSNSWFCPKIGWVDEKSDHNGTPIGTHLVLVSYQLASSPAQGAVDRFMAARIGRDETTLMSLLTDRLRGQVTAGAVPPSLIQVSNPCWYRYSILSLDSQTPTKASARVRVYEHFWAGDNGGGLPRSWEQDVVLQQVGNHWQVDQVGDPQNSKQEPGEPHGPTLSACSAAR